MENCTISFFNPSLMCGNGLEIILCETIIFWDIIPIVHLMGNKKYASKKYGKINSSNLLYVLKTWYPGTKCEGNRYGSAPFLD